MRARVFAEQFVHQGRRQRQSDLLGLVAKGVGAFELVLSAFGLQPSNLGQESDVIIVGDAKKFIEPLRQQFKSVDVIPLSELNLDSPTLRGERPSRPE